MMGGNHNLLLHLGGGLDRAMNVISLCIREKRVKQVPVTHKLAVEREEGKGKPYKCRDGIAKKEEHNADEIHDDQPLYIFNEGLRVNIELLDFNRT